MMNNQEFLGKMTLNIKWNSAYIFEFLTTTFVQSDKGESSKSTPNLERRRVTQSKEEKYVTNPNKAS